MKTRHLFLILSATVLIGCGCLSEPPAPPALEEFPAAVEPDGTRPPITADQAEGYTGAVIYGDPATCPPCHALIADLQWLSRNYRWSLGFYGEPEYTGREDFIIERPERAPDAGTPLIVYYRAGMIVDEVRGYTASEDAGTRRDMLKDLVQRHPTGAR